MLARSLKASPSLFLFLVFCVLFGWQLSGGTGYGDPIPTSQPAPAPAPEPESQEPPPPPPPPEEEPPPPPPKEEPPPPRPPRIAVVTFVTDQRSYVQLSLKNKDHYARRHGYDFVVDYESHTSRGTTWWKFDMMERLIKQEKWDWLWFVDFDTLITNTSIPLTSVIDEVLANVTKPEEVDWLKTHDCNGLNTGSFIVRSSLRTVKFLHDIYVIEAAAREEQKDRNLSEQDAMVELMKQDKASLERTVQVPQWKLNAFPQEIACFDESKRVWEHGMFVLHFAGAWAHVKGEDPTGQLMKKYEGDIIWGDWKDFY